MWKPQESNLWYQPTKLRSWAATGANMMRYKTIHPTVFLIEPLSLNSRGFPATSLHLPFIKICLVALLLLFPITSPEELCSNRWSAQEDKRFCLLLMGRAVKCGKPVCVSLCSLIYILGTSVHLWFKNLYFFIYLTFVSNICIVTI